MVGRKKYIQGHLHIAFSFINHSIITRQSEYYLYKLFNKNVTVFIGILLSKFIIFKETIYNGLKTHSNIKQL